MYGLKIFGWVLTGSAVGSAVALLMAPASGRETRRRIGRRIGDETHDLLRKSQRTLGKTSDYVQQQFAQGRRRLAQVVH
jgi:gas vesicle protein